MLSPYIRNIVKREATCAVFGIKRTRIEVFCRVLESLDKMPSWQAGEYKPADVIKCLEKEIKIQKTLTWEESWARLQANND